MLAYWYNYQFVSITKQNVTSNAFTMSHSTLVYSNIVNCHIYLPGTCMVQCT